MDELVRKMALDGLLWSVQDTADWAYLGMVACHPGYLPFPRGSEAVVTRVGVEVLRQAMREEWGLAD